MRRGAAGARHLHELHPQDLGIPHDPVWRRCRVPAVRGDIDDPTRLAWRTAPGRARGPEQDFIQRLTGDGAGGVAGGVEGGAGYSVFPMDRRYATPRSSSMQKSSYMPPLATSSGSPAGSKVFGSTRTRVNSFCPVVV